MTQASKNQSATGQLEDEDLLSHFSALGVGSVSAYKLWCYRNGLDKGLEKSPEQRREERALYASQQPVVDPALSKDHDPQRAAQLAQIFRGELNEDKLADIPSRVRKLYRAMEGQEQRRQAFAQLVLHSEKHSNFYRPQKMLKSLGNGMDNTCIAALAQLARHSADWCRPVETWRPKTNKQRAQFSSLARHLLARYAVPITLDSAFFMGDTPVAHQQQEWFKHVGFGQNIRTADLPIALSKRAAHLFAQIDSIHHTASQALRQAQVLALGANQRLAWTIGWSSIGSTLENEDFWVGVVHFFVNNHPMLSHTYVEPIIDYLRHQKYENERIVQADGSVVKGPPPQPNYAMKGRSADKLLRQVDDWHAQLSGLENMPLKTWNPCGLRAFSHQERDQKINRQVEWSAHELLTSAQLGVEGRVMHHCVGSYTDRCAAGERSIWSIRVVDVEVAEAERETMHVLTVSVDAKKRTVTEARGKYNLRPSDRTRLGKKRNANGLYLHFLHESARILRLWMDREGLSHA